MNIMYKAKKITFLILISYIIADYTATINQLYDNWTNTKLSQSGIMNMTEYYKMKYLAQNV